MVQALSYWGTSSQVLIKEAEKLGLEVEMVHKEKNLFFVKSTKKEVLFKSTDCGINSSLGYKIADDKQLTYQLLNKFHLPHPKTLYCTKTNFNGLFNDTGLSYPLVIKPLDGSHGEGVMMSIQNKEELCQKLKIGFNMYNTLIVQEEIQGDEYRIMLLSGKPILAYKRIPPFVIGNGILSIRELIEEENDTNSLRGQGYHSSLSYILVDDELEQYIYKQGYTLLTVLEQGVRVQIRGNSNVGTGGIIEDVLPILSNDIISTCREATQYCGLSYAGIDVLTKDITQPLADTGGVILEINATPGLLGSKKAGCAMLKNIFGI